ncbi:hypothetical protein OAC30_02140 [Burkholderiaceae bacterium]|nr:hypothetical protein [Burkholderiaceae bacterium]
MGLGTVMVSVMMDVVVNVVMNVADKKARQDGFRGRLCLRKA